MIGCSPITISAMFVLQQCKFHAQIVNNLATVASTIDGAVQSLKMVLSALLFSYSLFGIVY